MADDEIQEIEDIDLGDFNFDDMEIPVDGQNVDEGEFSGLEGQDFSFDDILDDAESVDDLPSAEGNPFNTENQNNDDEQADEVVSEPDNEDVVEDGLGSENDEVSEDAFQATEVTDEVADFDDDERKEPFFEEAANEEVADNSPFFEDTVVEETPLDTPFFDKTSVEETVSDNSPFFEDAVVEETPLDAQTEDNISEQDASEEENPFFDNEAVVEETPLDTSDFGNANDEVTFAETSNEENPFFEEDVFEEPAPKTSLFEEEESVPNDSPFFEDALVAEDSSVAESNEDVETTGFDETTAFDGVAENYSEESSEAENEATENMVTEEAFQEEVSEGDNSSIFDDIIAEQALADEDAQRGDAGVEEELPEGFFADETPSEDGVLPEGFFADEEVSETEEVGENPQEYNSFSAEEYVESDNVSASWSSGSQSVVSGIYEAQNAGYLKWYSANSNEKMFEIGKGFENTIFDADEECKTIHINVGYDCYGWEVQFADGVVMNLRDVREYQIRNGRLPNPSGRIIYGHSALSFSGVERIVIYESVRYFSYGI